VERFSVCSSVCGVCGLKDIQAKHVFLGCVVLRAFRHVEGTNIYMQVHYMYVYMYKCEYICMNIYIHV